MHGREDKVQQVLVRNHGGKRPLEDLDVDERIIVKHILKELAEKV
jgi:hypothetical protein